MAGVPYNPTLLVPSNDDVATRRTAHAQPSVPCLAYRWQQATGKSIPFALNGLLLERAVTYEEQCKTHGGLTLQQIRYLVGVAKTAAKKAERVVNNQCVSPWLSQTIGLTQTKDPLSFAIGTEFIRSWKGQDHIVVRTEHGLKWSGETFSSLSAVARAITGTRWNGHRFFGLDKKRRSP